MEKAVTVRARIPGLPDFLVLEDKTGMTIAQVSVADVSDADIRDMGKRWTEAMLEHAKKKRSAREGAE